MAKERAIDERDILNTLVNTIAPKYLSENVDKNRVSTFGYLTESLAHAWVDSVVLEQNRAEDYCPELSSNEIHVRQTAKLREIGLNEATPYTAYATLYITKEDILEKGTLNTDRSRTFTIDKRSTIVSNGATYTFESDILVRAIPRNNGTYVFSAVYTTTNTSDSSYVQLFEDRNSLGDEVIALLLRCRQVNYNIQEKIVTDMLQFTYEGLSFDYDDYLAGFDVSYCLPNSDTYVALDKEYYLTDSVSQSILYNDDDRNILYILMNPNLPITVNTMIRVEIQETLGAEGSMAVDNSATTFTLYKDNAYNYTGINITAEIITTPEGGDNGDTLADIRHRLIQAKMMRNNITTELDILNYINDQAANVQIIKKRNDIEDRLYYLYTLLRYNDEISPACTKKLTLVDEDFDYFENGGQTMVLKADRKFSLDPDTHMVTPIARDADTTDIRYILNLPFLVKINSSHMLSYFCNTIDTMHYINTKEINPLCPYNIIANNIEIFRNPLDDETGNQYTFTIAGALNTTDDLEIVDNSGAIIDDTKIMLYFIFKREGADAAYLPMKISSYDSNTRRFVFTATTETNDFITELETLHIIDGLYQNGTDQNYNSTIDYKDISIDVYAVYKTGAETEVANNTNAIFSYVPDIKNEYTMMNSYNVNPSNLVNLMIEMNKYARSQLALEVRDLEEGTFNYILDEVPFIEYEFSKEHLVDLYPVFIRMHNTYTDLITRTTDFDVSLKFINTYGPSQYITVTGTTPEVDESGVVQKNDDGTVKYVEDEQPIRNLNPQLRFKVYGVDAPIDDIRTYIYEYMRDNYIIDTSLYISNICTGVEQTFSSVRSIKYMGVDNYDSTYQEFTYRKPDLSILDNVKKYVPEVFNVTDIEIELDET